MNKNMKKPPHNSTRKKAMLEALTASKGIVTNACAVVGIDRGTHYNWLKEDADYAKAVADLDNVVLDFAENKLHELIDSGDTTATIFFLKTKGKKRGYIEKQEHEHSFKENAPSWLGSINEES